MRVKRIRSIFVFSVKSKRENEMKKFYYIRGPPVEIWDYFQFQIKKQEDFNNEKI